MKKISRDNTIIIYIIMVAIFLGILIAASLSFYISHKNSNTIQAGVHIKGTNISGLTKEEAETVVKAALQGKMNDNIILKYNNYEYYVEIEQIEAEFDIEASVDFAYQIGRNSNVFQNIKDYIAVLFVGIDIEPILKYNEEALNQYIDTIQSQLPDQLEQSSYYLEDDDELIITNGKNGAGIYKDELKETILAAIQDVSYSNSYIEIPTYTEYPDPIDVDAIHSDIYKAPQDAYFSTDPYVVYPHVVGVDFDVDKVKKLIASNPDDEEYDIKLTLTTPNKTTNDIGYEAFPNVLATFSTKYATSNTARTTNLKLAAGKINGTVVMPGDTFSYNKVVGKRTVAAGYQEAAVFENGTVTNGLGGGICQISTTLYDAVLFSNLEIVERRNHMFIPSYVDGGWDATVVWGSTDFKFKNNRDYPIKIETSVSGGIATVTIYGLKTDDDYEISLETETVKTIPFSTTYQSNSSYKSGSIIQSGKDGSVVDTYKIYKKNGVEVKREKISRDTYSAQNKIIAK
jgi:vancomycin resistance protein YoaR